MAAEHEGGDGTTASESPVAGSGWPNVMVFEDDPAFVGSLAPSRRARWTVRVHIDIWAPDENAYKVLRTEILGPRRPGMIIPTLKQWLRSMPCTPPGSPPLSLINALTFPRGTPPATGRLTYDLFVDYGPATKRYVFRFLMDVTTSSSGRWGNVRSALASQDSKDRERRLKGALKEILTHRGVLNRYNEAIIDSIDFP